jgi:hypothetical protein
MGNWASVLRWIDDYGIENAVQRWHDDQASIRIVSFARGVR